MANSDIKLNTEQRLVINELASNISRTVYGMQGTRDAKHSKAWSDYGYKDVLEFNDHYQMFRRFGIAKAGIKTPPNYCWKTKPLILEGDESEVDDGSEGKTTFEVGLKALFKRHKLWKKLKLVDEYQRVGHYGAFIVQVRGSDASDYEWDKPLDKIGIEQVVKFIPVYESQLEPSTYDVDKSSERYGQPVTYNFNENKVVNDLGDKGKNRSATIHHSRVIIFAEGADDDSIYGVPANEAGFNDLTTMEKIIGAGGEGFWKNASMKTAFSSKDKDAPAPTQDEIDVIDEAISDFVEGMDKHLLLGGMDGKVLSASLADPKEHFAIALMSYSASIDIASKVLVGTQTGRLAADEDGKFTLSNFQARREDWCTDMVTDVVDWLISHGVIEDKEYFVKWDDLLSPSDKDKFELGERLAKVIEIMQKNFGHSSIGIDEIAKIMGYTPTDDTVDDDVDGFEGDETIEDDTANA